MRSKSFVDYDQEHAKKVNEESLHNQIKNNVNYVASSVYSGLDSVSESVSNWTTTAFKTVVDQPIFNWSTTAKGKGEEVTVEFI